MAPPFSATTTRPRTPRGLVLALLALLAASCGSWRGSLAQQARPDCEQARGGCGRAPPAAAPAILSDLFTHAGDIAVSINGRNATFEELYRLSSLGTAAPSSTEPDAMRLPLGGGGGAAYIGNRSRAASLFYLSGNGAVVVLWCKNKRAGGACMVRPTPEANRRGLRFMHLDNGAQAKLWWIVLEGWSAPGGGGMLVTGGAHASIDRTYFRGCRATGGSMGGGMLVVDASADTREESGFANCSADIAISSPEPRGPRKRSVPSAQEYGSDRLGGIILQTLEFLDSTRFSISLGMGGGLAVVGENATFRALDNTVWQDNKAGFGGALVLAGAKAVLTDRSLFAGNSAEQAGGGLLAMLGASVLVNSGSEFTKNASPFGGNAFLFSGADLYADSTSFSGGSGSGSSQSVAGGNVGMYNASAHISNSVLSGGLANDGGAVSIHGGAALALVGSTVAKNQALELGGAVYAGGGSALEVTGTSFDGNRASLGGGHVVLTAGSYFVSSYSSYVKAEVGELGNGEATDADSSTNGRGGALGLFANSTVWSLGDVFSDNSAVSAGGAFYSSSSALMVNNATFSESNVRDNGTGSVFQIVDGSLLSMTDVRITNNVPGNPFSVGFVDRSSLWMEHCNITGNASSRVQESAVQLASSNATLLSVRSDQSFSCPAGDCRFYASNESSVQIDGGSFVDCSPFSCIKDITNPVKFSANICLFPAEDLDLYSHNPRFGFDNETALFSLCAQIDVVPVQWMLAGQACPGNDGKLYHSAICSASSFIREIPCPQANGYCPQPLSEPISGPSTNRTTGAAPSPPMPGPQASSPPTALSMGLIIAVVAIAAVLAGMIFVSAFLLLRRRARKSSDKEPDPKVPINSPPVDSKESSGPFNAPENGGHSFPIVQDIEASVVFSSNQPSDASGTSSQKQAGVAAILPLASVNETINMNGNAGEIDLTINFESEIKPYLHPSSRIGSGGFGDVYRMPIRGRDAAVKVFTRGYTGATEEQYNSFIQELELMGKFQNCDQIVKIYGASVARPHVAIAYELVDGGSLADRIRDSAMPGGRKMTRLEILRAGYDIALGLAYLHPAVVHRDLKPGNVLIAKNGMCKLIDFGVSRNKDPFESYLNTAAGGTPNYMAPELFNSNQMDEKVDVYALGLILWEMVTGKTAWDDCENFAQIVMAVAIMAERPEIPEDVPKPLQRLITKCWHDDSHKRPSAPEVARLLQYMIKEEEDLVVVGPESGKFSSTSATEEESGGAAVEELASASAVEPDDASSKASLEPNSVEQVDRAQMVRRRLEEVKTTLNNTKPAGLQKQITRAESGIKELLDHVVQVEQHGGLARSRSQRLSPPLQPDVPSRAQSSRFLEEGQVDLSSCSPVTPEDLSRPINQM